MQKIIILVITCFVVTPTHCLACLWDYDTLAMERQRFPYAHELIAGHFLRHSNSYYEWRVVDRNKKTPMERTPANYDDLAVAYDKLGQHDKAIQTIREKIERWPNESRYESEANLGTFLFHAGRLEEGLPHINRAIEINPDAHFGRELYQKLLVEYLLQQGYPNSKLPLNQENRDSPVGVGDGPVGFAQFVINAQQPKEEDQQEELQRAAKGLLGMMRFGNYRSPVLLEALGDLMLLMDDRHTDAKMLAARAYLKASYEVQDSIPSKRYRDKAKQVLELQPGYNLSQIEQDLKQEIEHGMAFFHQIKDDEKSWLAARKNLDHEYTEKYYNATPPELSIPFWRNVSGSTRLKLFILSLLLGFVAVVFVTFMILRKWIRSGTAHAQDA